MIRNKTGSSTGRANGVCEVIGRAGARVTKRGGSGASYTLGVKTVKSSKGEMAKRAQGEWRILDKSEKLAAKRASCSTMRDHDIEAGLTKLMRDVVWRMEGDECCDVLEANKALLKAQMN